MKGDKPVQVPLEARDKIKVLRTRTQRRSQGAVVLDAVNLYEYLLDAIDAGESVILRDAEGRDSRLTSLR